MVAEHVAHLEDGHHWQVHPDHWTGNQTQINGLCQRATSASYGIVEHVFSII